MGPTSRAWTFFTNHACVLLAIDAMPALAVREIASRCGITERATYTILSELEASGYVIRTRAGRRVMLRLQLEQPLPPPYAATTLGGFLDALRQSPQS